MAVITPQTDIWLLKVPLEISDMNQLTFENATAQYNYFNSLPKLQAGDYTYQRKDGTIRYAGQFDDVINYNYVMYRNDAYSDKWFYAFITDTQYISDGMTAITIKTDCWQTWQFELNFKPCLIDREHTNDDTVGKNTLPEGLELGEFVTNGSVRNFESSTWQVIVIEVSQIENNGDGGSLSCTWEDGYTHNQTPTMNGIPRGTTPLIVEYNSSTAPQLEDVREIYDLAGLGESIVNVYPLPRELIGGANLSGYYVTLTYTPTGGGTPTEVQHVYIPNSTSSSVDMGTHTFTKPTSLAGYIPKNNKLLTYPYCYFNISNNAGTSVPYHYEDFSTDNVVFKAEGAFCVGGSVKAIPQSYKRLGSSENALDYSITAAKYPTASWKSDSYTNWLTQNAVNMQIQWQSTAVSAAVDIVGGAMAGGAAGATLGTVAAGKEIIETAREQHIAKTRANFVPDQVNGNVNAGDFVWSKYRSPFTYLPMCIKPEYSRPIDEFFSQYGYKCNRVKEPNITGRRNWNYVKTVGCYIEGDIPQTDMQEIKSMFDRGITLWHNPANFANYNANNDII